MLMEKFWVVKNPTEHTTKSECCFEADMAFFVNYVFGTGKERFEQENHVLHTSELTASADADFRLKIRDDLVKILNANKESLRKLGEQEKA